MIKKSFQTVAVMALFTLCVSGATRQMTEEDRNYWAFQPIKAPAPPEVKSRNAMGNPIDAFILLQLQAKGIAPNPPASRRELARRVSFDLIGLPPTPEEVVAFENDSSTDAYERLIDRLLGSPRYGERWARHWLDLARFAQSNGYERDGEKPLAWRYRDYVIKAFNEDKAYDRFIMEQIAGDELPDATKDSIVATGFQRLGVWDDEPDDKKMAEYDEIDDVISTTSAAFLGITMGCARCHDHKFDPIPQADYYQFVAFFRNVRPYESAKLSLDASNYVPLESPGAVREWRKQQQSSIKHLKEQIASAASAELKKMFEEELKKTTDEKPPFPWALAVRERGREPLPTHVLVRGNARSEGDEVEPKFLTVLGGEKPALPQSDSAAESTGRRLAFARWVASPQNPLTARVIVNRVWQHLFGKGIVKTSTDFGKAGVPPTNPELLDWLAAEFMRGGWSIKKLQKLILLSNAYQMSSRAENDKGRSVDPANDLLWRQNLRRLEAEAIRDSVLRISGALDYQMGGRGFFPHLGGEVLAGESRPGLDWEKSTTSEQARRSIYTYIRRTMLPPVFEQFDYNNTATPLGERPVTTVAPQALLLLNEDFMQEQAAVFASRLLADSKNRQQQIQRAYQLAFARDPAPREERIAGEFIERQTRAFEDLSSRMTFRLDVPISLSVEYMKQLAPEDFLIGPREGWSYFRGRWSSAYEGIRTMDRARGPFALWMADKFMDGTIEADLAFERAADFVSILLRSQADKEEQRGYEVVFVVREQKVILRRQAGELRVLGEAPFNFSTSAPLHLKIQVQAGVVEVFLADSKQPILRTTDLDAILESGYVGIRAFGAPAHLDNLRIRGGSGDPARITAPQKQTAAARALQSFCLLLLNLNEVVYVD